MQHRTGREIRTLFLEFFRARGHAVLPSASIVPENDPTALFITAGMHPLVPYLLGSPHPEGRRLANSQKCVRTQDILEVGDATHDTCFEMLGNWSLGDYFKQEAIQWSMEFLTSEKFMGISKDRLVITVFSGDNDAPRDEEASNIWESVGIPRERIFHQGKEHNWWGPAGATGPCGPDTEIFVWTGEGTAPICDPTQEPRYVEVWNNVFMQYFKEDNGSFRELEQKNVDTGMGLERIAMISQSVSSIFETDLFLPLMQRLDQIVSKPSSITSDLRARRIIADHVRTGAMMISDGVRPSNKDQGYILRRLLRRAIVQAETLDIRENFLVNLLDGVSEIYGDVYPNLSAGSPMEEIASVMRTEEEKFRKTLTRGMSEFQKIVNMSVDERISGVHAFQLFSTYGFPLELTEELGALQHRSVDTAGFWKEFETHQQLSRKGAEQKFAGGLADHSAETMRHHTATHLLHQALRDVLGETVFQKGSNVTRERLRFDFSYPTKVTPEQLKRVEKIVQEQIRRDLPVSFEVMDVSEARRRGAIGVFEERYGNKVKVYSMGDYSKEICGGPHVEHTGVLKGFKILKEEAVSAGIRRIKAVATANLDLVEGS
ncbi:MAG: alanine--tRNA ligase [Candidatus Kerfeldbacteria bacterium]|nr:alanine--tRNA ligase [Candidatus Kerfeldbacteria bacterium]